jgi:hypothetical protein
VNKLAWEAHALQVTESAAREPVAIVYAGSERKVEGILCRWRMCQEWWKRPSERDYFRVRLDSGLICEVFRDIQSGCWQLQRVYD